MLDSKTNKVFFSAQLTQTYRKCKKPIIDALKKNGIEIGSDIRQTKDIWARDYMPIQVGDNKFMRYRYNPDYLVKVQGMSEFITDKPECNFLRDKDVIDCDVILDGGNVVVCGNKIILTEKVFKENGDLTKYEITKRIESASEKQVVWIPCDPNEIKECEKRNELPLCHADGILHAIDNETILLSNYIDYDLEYRSKLLERLSPYFKIKEFHFGEISTEKSWIYINYLQVGSVVLMPTVNEEADDIAVKQLKEFLQVDSVIKIDSRELTFDAKDESVGGSLHCISWNVFDSSIQKTING